MGIKAAPIRYHAPAMNAHVERFIGVLKQECVDRFIVMGTRHLDYLVGEFVENTTTASGLTQALGKLADAPRGRHRREHAARPEGQGGGQVRGAPRWPVAALQAAGSLWTVCASQSCNGFRTATPG